MADTYDQHKARVDAAMPTPTFTWELFSEDTPHIHDDQAVARSNVITFDGQDFQLEMHSKGIGDRRFDLESRQIVGEADPRLNYWGRQTSVADAFLETQRTLASWSEGIRARIATENYIRDLLADEGLVYPDPPGPPVSARATLDGIAPHAATQTQWTLAPAFSPETLAYELSTAHAAFFPVLTLGHSEQKVMWTHGDSAYSGAEPSLTLVDGENIISIAVVSEDRINARVYTLTVTKTA